MNKKILMILLAAAVIVSFLCLNGGAKQDGKLVAIANYGPHESLTNTIDGIKRGLTDLGYVEGKNIRYKIIDVNFETSLIAQMISTLKSSKPDVIVTLSTPVAQTANKMVSDKPLVFVNVTDPLEAGLLKDNDRESIIISDQQNVHLMLQFAQKLVPNAKRVGLMYSISEANDGALLKMLNNAASELGLTVDAVPLEHSRDAAMRIRSLKGKVDFLYTGSSAAVQTALPAIVRGAEEMSIPVIDFDLQSVLNHEVLASYGVSHTKIGRNAARFVDRALKGLPMGDDKVIYPLAKEHAGYVSLIRAKKMKFNLPQNLGNVTLVQ